MAAKVKALFLGDTNHSGGRDAPGEHDASPLYPLISRGRPDSLTAGRYCSQAIVKQLLVFSRQSPLPVASCGQQSADTAQSRPEGLGIIWRDETHWLSSL